MTVDPLPVLDDRYALDEVIAHGGMADVYRGTDRLLLRPVSVKILREVAETGLRDRFVAEARTLASLNHPGLITLLDAGILDESPYLVLELATGPTLSARILEAPLDPEYVREIGRQLAEALAYAHEQGVVHRDVKPSNVLLCEDDRVVLADFGIARLVGQAEHYTKSGDTIGSPAYLAPEQVAAEPIGPAADVYSLGLVLLEALTGVRAYAGSPVEAAVARLHAGPVLPTHLGAAWRSLIVRMTQRDPGFRPSAAEVAAELTDPSWSELHERAAVDTGQLESTGEQPAVGRPEQRRRPRRSVSSGRRVWLASSLGLLTVVALVAVLLTTSWSQPPKADSDPVIPSGVPTRLQEPLANLHDAVEGHHP